MSVFWNVVQFVAVVGAMLVGGYFLLRKFDRALTDKIDAKIEELKELFGK